MPILSGTPIAWSKAFDVERSVDLFLGCAATSVAEMLKISHKCVGTTKAPEDATTQLCSIKFGNIKAMQQMPNGFSATQNTVSGYNNGVIDSMPIAMLFSGGLMRGHKSMTLNLTYTGGLALTTLTPNLMPDPDSGTYPSGATYKVVADGATVAEASFVPSATPLNIAVNKTVTNLAITISIEDGGCLMCNWLPNSAVLQNAPFPSFGVLLDPWGGNSITLPGLTIAYGVSITTLLVTPNFV
jgi:hypothetical protein